MATRPRAPSSRILISASIGPLTALDRDGDQVWHEDRSRQGQGVLGHRGVRARQFLAVVGVGEIPQRIAAVPTSESSHGEQDDHEAVESRARASTTPSHRSLSPRPTAMKVAAAGTTRNSTEKTTPLSLLCSTIRRIIDSLPSGPDPDYRGENPEEAGRAYYL
jgi:hypothetical protein